MNKSYKCVIISLMIIFIFAQIFYINKFKQKKTNEVCTMKEYKTLAQLNEELNCLKEKNILCANKVDGNWNVKIKVKGDRQELINELSKLQKYEINNFIVNKNKEENSVILELSSK